MNSTQVKTPKHRPHHPAPKVELGDFTTDSTVIKLSAMALVIGCFSALIARVLLWLIALFTNLCYFGRISVADAVPSAAKWGPAIVLIPVIGGVVIGLMARFGSEKIRGHGIPEALEAILMGKSNIEPKVALLKPLSSAISIGTGGPFGAEGPIIMTGGAFGSLFAQFVHLSSAERKTLLVAGAAGGMSAVFGTPMAAVLLAVELLLFEWKPRSLIPVAVASVAASAMRVPLLGAGPIFPIVPHTPVDMAGLGFAALVGLITGFASGLLTTMVYAFEDLFLRFKFHWMWWPALGGLFVGIAGLIDPRVLGVGYGTIHSLLNGQVIGMAALGLIIGKSLTWSFALGSGTSGGVLAPLLMMGGAIGALLGQFIPAGSPGLWAMVGMSAMMGGTMRAPFTAVIFTLELTYDIQVLPALLIGCIASEGVTVLLLKRSILTEKLARRGHHLSREYVVDPFEVHRVREVMVQDRPSIEAGVSDVLTVHSDDVLRQAVTLMLEHDLAYVPVLGRDEQVVGYIDRSCVMDARLRWYEEEHVREKVRGK
jgi:H+/Cl- antiporter ClcA